jgi:hypothetical protein
VTAKQGYGEGRGGERDGEAAGKISLLALALVGIRPCGARGGHRSLQCRRSARSVRRLRHVARALRAKQLSGPGWTVPGQTVVVGWAQLASFHLIKVFSKYFQLP